MKHPISHIFIAGMFPVFIPLIVQAQNLRLTEGVHLVMQGSPFLVLNNAGIINDGNITCDSGTVLFTDQGATGNNTIGGSRPISFNNLRIDKSFTDVELGNDIQVTGHMEMQKGNVLLNNHLIDLGNTGMINGESDLSFITGTQGGMIITTVELNAPHALNPGNIGVELTSQARLGLTRISRSHVQQTGIHGEISVFRYFEIDPELNTGLDASLKFYWLNGELAGNNQNELSLYTSLYKTSAWSAVSTTNPDRGDHSVMESHLDQLHLFTLAVGANKGSGLTNRNPAALAYPNPAVDGFTLSFYSGGNKTEIVQLFDPVGHLLEQKEIYCQAGTNTVRWNIGKYAAGTYLLRFGNPSLHNLSIVKK